MIPLVLYMYVPNVCNHIRLISKASWFTKTICMLSIAWSGEGNLFQVSVFHDQKGAPTAQLVECRT